MSSQATRECWYRYIRLSEEEKKDFREKLNLIEKKEWDHIEYATTEDREEGWYFWDEVMYNSYGPYKTEAAARKEIKKYCAEELGIDIPSGDGVDD